MDFIIFVGTHLAILGVGAVGGGAIGYRVASKLTLQFMKSGQHQLASPYMRAMGAGIGIPLGVYGICYICDHVIKKRNWSYKCVQFKEW